VTIKEERTETEWKCIYRNVAQRRLARRLCCLIMTQTCAVSLHSAEGCPTGDQHKLMSHEASLASMT